MERALARLPELAHQRDAHRAAFQEMKEQPAPLRPAQLTAAQPVQLPLAEVGTLHGFGSHRPGR